MGFNELLQSFAAKLGMASIDIENDMAALEIDGMAFGFIHNPEKETLTLVADIGQAAIDANGEFGSMMLKANFLYEALNGAVLFQNPDNEAFGIQERFRMVDLDADSLYAHVERLSNTAEEWREIVAGYGEAEVIAQKRQIEHQENPFAASDFMRV